MPQILVTKPFRVQFARGKHGLRNFEPGTHSLTSEELEHWFVQGAIAEGRAELLPGDEPVAPQVDHDDFALAMFGDSASEGILAELVATTKTTVTIIPEVKIAKVEAKPASKKDAAKPVATKKAGK